MKVRAEDGLSGGGRQTESRADQREEPGYSKKEPRWIRRREEPGRRQEGAGGARRDPDPSQDGGPRWSRRREEPWWRKG